MGLNFYNFVAENSILNKSLEFDYIDVCFIKTMCMLFSD